MDLDGPKSPESTSMEIDEEGVSDSHVQPVQTSSSSDLSGHSFAGSNPPSQSSPRFSGPTNPSGEAGDIHMDDHGLAPLQRRDRLPTSPPPTPEATESRKRKITRLSPHADHSDLTRDAHPSSNVAESSTSSSSIRRTRPRLFMPQRDREFTPLLIMSPRRELEEEETLTTFQYAPMPGPMVTDSDLPRSIVRRYHPPLPRLDEHHGPRILRSSYSPTAADVEARHQGRRQNSASSFEQVALASTTSTSPTTPTTGSLSTLSNLSLPRPFDDGAAPAPAPTVPAATAAEPPESARGTTIIKVHERGIDASGPLFPAVPSSCSTRGGGGLRRSPVQARGAAPFQIHFHFHAAHQAVEPGASPLLGGPLCESPVSFYPGVALSPPGIDPDDIRRVISAPIGCTQRVPVTFRSLPAT